MSKEIIDILEGLNITTDKIDLYITAFTHQSYANEHNVESNERLEYLGDAVLNFLVAEYLYGKYPNLPEGNLTKIRAKYVCASAASRYATTLNLPNAILLGRGESEQGGRRKLSVLGDLFEAFLGALYLDKGLKAVKDVLDKVLFPYIKDIDISFFTDFKSRLQEYIQGESRKGVEYVLEKEEGPPHDKTFYVNVMHDNIKLGSGSGKSKKEAEQRAAEYALKKLAIS